MVDLSSSRVSANAVWILDWHIPRCRFDTLRCEEVLDVVLDTSFVLRNERDERGEKNDETESSCEFADRRFIDRGGRSVCLSVFGRFAVEFGFRGRGSIAVF